MYNGVWFKFICVSFGRKPFGDSFDTGRILVEINKFTVNVPLNVSLFRGNIKIFNIEVTASGSVL